MHGNFRFSSVVAASSVFAWCYLRLESMSGRVTRAGAKLASSASSLPPPASPAKRSRPTSTSATSPSTPKRAKAAPAKGKVKVPESPYVPPTPNTQRQIETEAHEAEERGAEDGAVLLHPELKFRYEDAKKHLTSVDARWGVVMSQLTCVGALFCVPTSESS